MTRDVTLPPAMFDLDETGELTPPVFEPAGHGVGLTAFGRHEGLGPNVWDGFGQLCGDARYGTTEQDGRRVWVWHACSRTGEHEQHKCDRCEETW